MYSNHVKCFMVRSETYQLLPDGLLPDYTLRECEVLESGGIREDSVEPRFRRGMRLLCLWNDKLVYHSCPSNPLTAEPPHIRPLAVVRMGVDTFYLPIVGYISE